MFDMPMHEGRELPTIYVRSADLPEFMGWGLNTDHYVVMRVRLVGKEAVTIDQERDRGEKFEGKLQIVSMKGVDMEPADRHEMEQAEFARVKAKIHDSFNV